MTPYEHAKALIALAEQTYIENYYGDNLALFNRSETTPGTDAGEQSDTTDKGE